MAKKATKGKIISGWREKKNEAKILYNKAREKDKSLPGFYRSDLYKNIKQRQDKSLKRFEKRDQINERKRELYSTKKQIENVRKENGLIKYDNVSVFKAFSGDGRVFEDSVLKANEGKKFVGSIEKNGRIRYFDNYSDFKINVNSFLSKMYKKDKNGDNYEAFNWNIERNYKLQNETLFISYEFTKTNFTIEDESNDENDEFADDESEDFNAEDLTDDDDD